MCVVTVVFPVLTETPPPVLTEVALAAVGVTVVITVLLDEDVDEETVDALEEALAGVVELPVTPDELVPEVLEVLEVLETEVVVLNIVVFVVMKSKNTFATQPTFTVTRT